MLAEHGQWAKCHCPFYAEVAHTPCLCGTRGDKSGERAHSSWCRPSTCRPPCWNFSASPLFADMQGRPLRGVMERDEPIHEGALFGLFGGQVCCTDGGVGVHAQPGPGKRPRYEYTLMPTRHGGRRAFMSNEVLRTARLAEPLPFSKGVPVLRVESRGAVLQAGYPTMLFCVRDDPGQEQPVQDEAQERRMTALLKELMRRSDAPAEQYERLGLD